MGAELPRGETSGQSAQEAGRSGDSSKARAAKLSRKGLAWIGVIATTVVGGVATTVATGLLPLGQSAKSSPSPTSRVIYEPWTLSGALSRNIRIVSTRSGSCWRESLAAPRLNAYRCIVKNLIFDPCFGNPFGSTSRVVCAYPSASSVTVIRLTKQLPFFAAPAPLSYPWLLVLANGESCYFETGGTADAAGLRLNYGCPNNAYLYGPIDHSGRTWTIFEQRDGRPGLTEVHISKAYF